jgi:hypothetical protein
MLRLTVWKTFTDISEVLAASIIMEINHHFDDGKSNSGESNHSTRGKYFQNLQANHQSDVLPSEVSNHSKYIYGFV